MENKHIYSISELNSLARQILEGGLGQIWISGEISNLVQASSGHLYFSLKDGQAQARCALFRMNGRRLNFSVKNGQQIIALAQVSLYEPRGDFQLIVQHLELSGSGALQKAFELLKKRLGEAGLFAESHKKPLPLLPTTIGVITSSQGAAIHDVLTVLKKRFPAIPVIIYPTLVQGNQAAPQIVKALQTANQRKECDVLILTRGGGSIEDLWPFNEEIVAHAIYASQIPVISAVGHEIDYTIADFVADVRAPTPSAAAERVSPDWKEWLRRLEQLKQRLVHLQISLIRHCQVQLDHIGKRLRHPGQRLRDQAQSLDLLEHRLMLAHHHFLRHHYAELNRLIMRWQHFNPLPRIERDKDHVQLCQKRLLSSLEAFLNRKQQAIQQAAQALQALSPLQTLERGFSIVRDKVTEKIINDAAELQPGKELRITFARGSCDCQVLENIQ